ncbi:MAG: Ser-Thr-rich GPI-anchored membrane family protein, partial [Patescibacteria group bacterium]|nr:Ser-Thr-rich GPI-anchored membrane family protein [Patescibacteria group bacterium]
KIIATNGDVPISGISLGIKPKSSMGLVKNIKVYDGSVLIGSLNSFSTLYAENFDYAWGSVSSSIIVPNNTYKVLTLKGDIASTGLGSFQVGIVGFKHGLNSINSNNFGSIFGNTMSVNPLSMAVSLDMSTPANQNLIAGQIATFAKIELINSSAADISNMNRIQIASDSSINPSSYLTDIKIYDGSKQIGKVAGDLVYNGSYYYAWVNVSDVSIPGYSSKTLTIKADIKSYVPGGFVRLGIAGFNFDSPGCAVSGTPMYGNNMTIISSAPQRSISVLSPNGGEQLIIGKTYDIAWDYSGINEIGIYLLDFYGIGEEILINRFVPASSNVYSWIVTNNIVASNEYKIELRGYYGSNPNEYISDKSNGYFTISEPATGCDARNISVWDWNYCTSECPCSAGEGDCDSDADCTTGYCHNNVGANYGQTSSMDVCENKSTTITPTCIDNDEDYGFFTKGKVYGTRPDGTSYTTYDSCNGSNTQVNEMWCYDNPNGQGKVAGRKVIDCEYGCSDGACKEGITVTSPTYKKQLQAGSTFRIEWSSAGFRGLDIVLAKGGTTHTTVVKGIDVSKGYYDWKIPTNNIASGDDYSLRFFRRSVPGALCLKETPLFTITAASTSCHTTAPWSWEYCTPECPCDAGEGDCDSDADCTTGYCHNNVGA